MIVYDLYKVYGKMEVWYGVYTEDEAISVMNKCGGTFKMVDHVPTHQRQHRDAELAVQRDIDSSLMKGEY